MFQLFLKLSNQFTGYNETICETIHSLFIFYLLSFYSQLILFSLLLLLSFIPLPSPQLLAIEECLSHPAPVSPPTPAPVAPLTPTPVKPPTPAPVSTPTTAPASAPAMKPPGGHFPSCPHPDEPPFYLPDDPTAITKPRQRLMGCWSRGNERRRS